MYKERGGTLALWKLCSRKFLLAALGSSSLVNKKMRLWPTLTALWWGFNDHTRPVSAQSRDHGCTRAATAPRWFVLNERLSRAYQLENIVEHVHRASQNGKSVLQCPKEGVKSSPWPRTKTEHHGEDQRADRPVAEKAAPAVLGTHVEGLQGP